MGYKLRPEHFRSWSKPIRVLSNVPVSRNWYKLCKIYTKTHICEIWYKILSFKQIIFWKRRYPRGAWKTQVCSFYFEFKNFSFLLIIYLIRLYLVIITNCLVSLSVSSDMCQVSVYTPFHFSFTVPLTVTGFLTFFFFFEMHSKISLTFFLILKILESKNPLTFFYFWTF